MHRAINLRNYETYFFDRGGAGKKRGKQVPLNYHFHESIVFLNQLLKRKLLSRTECFSRLGVKARNMKMDFHTRGTWHRVVSVIEH